MTQGDNQHFSILRLRAWRSQFAYPESMKTPSSFFLLLSFVKCFRAALL